MGLTSRTDKYEITTIGHPGSIHPTQAFLFRGRKHHISGTSHKSRHSSLLIFGAVIQVDSILYNVHRYFFCRDSDEFVTRLRRLPVQEQASPPVISLENVKSKDFDAFLSVLYPPCVLLARVSTSQVVDPLFLFPLLGISIQRRNARLKSCCPFWTYPLGGVLPAFAKWPFAV